VAQHGRGHTFRRIRGDPVAKSGVSIKLIKNLVPKFRVNFNALVKKEVLVGVPADKAERKTEPGEKEGMNNATIAYIQDNGSPAANIPARPFMQPGITAAQSPISARMKQAALNVIDGGEDAGDTALNQAGLIAQSSIRKVIGEGIPPPLAPSTVANRFRQRKTKTRRKGETEYLRLIGQGSSAEDAQKATGIKPLLNTGQLRNSITYVLRKR
jgi:hypothetical protein